MSDHGNNFYLPTLLTDVDLKVMLRTTVTLTYGHFDVTMTEARARNPHLLTRGILYISFDFAIVVKMDWIAVR